MSIPGSIVVISSVELSAFSFPAKNENHSMEGLETSTPKGMERCDLLEPFNFNHAIFETQGMVLNRKTSTIPIVKIVVRVMLQKSGAMSFLKKKLFQRSINTWGWTGQDAVCMYFTLIYLVFCVGYER